MTAHDDEETGRAGYYLAGFGGRHPDEMTDDEIRAVADQLYTKLTADRDAAKRRRQAEADES